MSQSSVRVGILGCGVVGGGVYQLLQRRAAVIERLAGVRIEPGAVADIDWERNRDFEVEAGLRTEDAMAVCEDEQIDIIVETIGGIGAAHDFVMAAIFNGKSVVTSNKELIAKKGAEILDAAAEQNVDVQFEAAVGGVIPIIRSLHESLAADRITRILGIVNGTTNYILTKMSNEGRQFEDVLDEAQDLGYAEPDPTADIEGIDPQNKLAILTAIAFGQRVNVDEIYAEGIRDITPTDIEYARQMDHVVKLLAIANRNGERIEARVHPCLVPVDHPLASVNDVFNAIFVQGEASDDVMLYGQGAGAMPTGNAVVGDIVDCARNIVKGAAGHVPCTCEGQADIMPIDDVVSRVYLRMLVKDRPGVLGSIATIFGHEDVSIESVIQEGNIGTDLAEIVWLMHPCVQRNLDAALQEIRQLDVVASIPALIRVEQ